MRHTATFRAQQEKIELLWETRAGRLLRRVGLRSVRTTIFTLALLATLIPAGATSWISYRQSRLSIDAKLNEQLTGASTQGGREVGLWLKERLYDLKVFATSYEVVDGIERRAGTSSGLLRYLASVNDRFPDFDEMLVIGPDERTIASSSAMPGKVSFTGNWMSRARDGNALLGDPARADTSAGITVDVAVPIQSLTTGRFLGVIAARLDFVAIEHPLRGLAPGSEGRLLMVRPDGEPIVAVGTTFAPMPAAILRRLRNAEGTTVTYDATDGEPVLGVLSEIPQNGWMVIAEIPAATAYSEFRELRNATILLVLVLLLVVGSLAWALGLLIVLPLERLSRASTEVAEGRLDVHVPTAGGGEVAQLATVFNDMVRRLRSDREVLERLSVTDELTGLANRRRLTMELEREVQRSDRHDREFAVLMLDVDRFKHFNDTFGHQTGDMVLRRIARILSDTARDVDTVARYGGEEFLMILPETNAEGAARMAERIRVTTERDRFAVDEESGELNVTLSIGFAIFPAHAREAESLIEAADAALYRSKEEGRNRVSAAG